MENCAAVWELQQLMCELQPPGDDDDDDGGGGDHVGGGNSPSAVLFVSSALLASSSRRHYGDHDYHYHRRMLRRLDRLLEQIHVFLLNRSGDTEDGDRRTSMSNDGDNDDGIMSVHRPLDRYSDSITTTRGGYMDGDENDDDTDEVLHSNSHRNNNNNEYTSSYPIQNQRSFTNNTALITTNHPITLIPPLSLRRNLIHILTRLSIPPTSSSSSGTSSSSARKTHNGRIANNDATTTTQQQQQQEQLFHSITGPLTISILQKSMNIQSLLPSSSSSLLSESDLEPIFQQLIHHNPPGNDHDPPDPAQNHSRTATSIWLSLLMTHYMERFGEENDTDHDDDDDNPNRGDNMATTTTPETIVVPYLPPLMQLAQRMLYLEQSTNTMIPNTNSSSSGIHHPNSSINEQVQQWQIVVGYMIRSWTMIPPTLLQKDHHHNDDATLLLPLQCSTYLTELIQFTIDIVDTYAIDSATTGRNAPTINSHDDDDDDRRPDIGSTTTSPPPPSSSFEEHYLFPYLTICINLLKSLEFWFRSSSSVSCPPNGNVDPVVAKQPQQELRVTYRNQLVLLWTTFGTTRMVPTSSNQYQMCYYQLQLTDLVLSSSSVWNTSTTATTASQHGCNHTDPSKSHDPGIPTYHDIPNEKIFMVIFLRALQYPDLLLLEWNHPIWSYLQQQIAMATERPEVSSHLKRMIQAATLTFQKQHLMQLHNNDRGRRPQQYDEEQPYDHGHVRTHDHCRSVRNHHAFPCSTTRLLFDRLLSVVSSTDGRTGSDDVGTDDPWDQLFWKTIQQYS